VAGTILCPFAYLPSTIRGRWRAFNLRMQLPHGHGVAGMKPESPRFRNTRNLAALRTGGAASSGNAKVASGTRWYSDGGCGRRSFVGRAELGATRILGRKRRPNRRPGGSGKRRGHFAARSRGHNTPVPHGMRRFSKSILAIRLRLGPDTVNGSAATSRDGSIRERAPPRLTQARGSSTKKICFMWFDA